jgi:hypothetical protein
MLDEGISKTRSIKAILVAEGGDPKKDLRKGEQGRLKYPSENKMKKGGGINLLSVAEAIAKTKSQSR